MARNISNLGSDINRMQQRFKSAALNQLGRIVMVEALNHFEESWDTQGFTDTSVQKWRARKAPSRQVNKNGSRSKSATRWEKQNNGRAILVGHQSNTTGTHLKDSLRGSYNSRSVTISTDKPYAQVHNEGGKSGRGSGFTMPQRQFMGPSRRLDEKVARKFDREMDNLFKKL